MKKFTAPAAVVLVGLMASAVIGAESDIKATLEPVNNSGVTGFVQLVQLPHGGSNIHVQASGLEPGQTYTSFYYESADCTAPADSLETFTADENGNGQANGKIDDDLDEVGSVSVRLGTGYGDLQACAAVHE